MASPCQSTLVNPCPPIGLEFWNSDSIPQTHTLNPRVKQQTHQRCPTNHTQQPLKFQFLQVDYGPSYGNFVLSPQLWTISMSHLGFHGHFDTLAPAKPPSLGPAWSTPRAMTAHQRLIPARGDKSRRKGCSLQTCGARWYQEVRRFNRLTWDGTHSDLDLHDTHTHRCMYMYICIYTYTHRCICINK